MNDIIKMTVYGSDLSGREFGKQAFEEAIQKNRIPISLDFTDVGSIGSSFADEFVAEIARLQNSRIIIINANRVIKSCLNDVASDKKIVIDYQITHKHE